MFADLAMVITLVMEFKQAMVFVKAIVIMLDVQVANFIVISIIIL